MRVVMFVPTFSQFPLIYILHLLIFLPWFQEKRARGLETFCKLTMLSYKIRATIFAKKKKTKSDMSIYINMAFTK